MFPEGAGYEHDKMERRTELTEEQKPAEPQNADRSGGNWAPGVLDVSASPYCDEDEA